VTGNYINTEAFRSINRRFRITIALSISYTFVIPEQVSIIILLVNRTQHIFL